MEPALAKYLPQWSLKEASSSARIILLVAAVAACGSEPMTPRARPASVRLSLDAAARAELMSAAQGRMTRGFEDEILRMENAVPGFGGVFMDAATKQLVVYLRDTTQKAAAFATLRSLAPTLHVDRGFKSKLGIDGGTVVRQGEFAFSALVAWQQAISAGLRDPSVRGLDADEARNRVRIDVLPTTDVARVTQEIMALGVVLPGS